MKIIKLYKSFIIIILISFFSLFPFKFDSQTSFINIPHPDKIVHFGFYFFLSVILLNDLIFTIKTPKLVSIISVFWFSLLLGVLLEWIQEQFIPERSGCFYDILAGILGLMAGIVSFNKCSKFSKLLQRF
jgi:VanZ family protein